MILKRATKKLQDAGINLEVHKGLYGLYLSNPDWKYQKQRAFCYKTADEAVAAALGGARPILVVKEGVMGNEQANFQVGQLVVYEGGSAAAIEDGTQFVVEGREFTTDGYHNYWEYTCRQVIPNGRDLICINLREKWLHACRHPNAEVVGECSLGCCDDFYCPDCKKKWRVEVGD